MPLYYKANRLSVIGPGEDVIWPAYAELLDYEMEFGFFIGKAGRDIWKKANGIDNTPLVPFAEAKSISTERTFGEDTTDIIKLKALLLTMTEKLAFQLRSSCKLCSCVAVKIRYADFNTYTLQAKIPYTASDNVLIEKVRKLFDKLYERRVLIRLIGVRLSDLVSGNLQINLFEETHMISLYQAMDRMQLKHGSGIIRRAAGIGESRDPWKGPGDPRALR